MIVTVYQIESLNLISYYKHINKIQLIFHSGLAHNDNIYIMTQFIQSGSDNK